MEVYKAGTTELTLDDVKRIYDKKFIVNYSGVYQAIWSAAQNDFYFAKVLNAKRLAQRGRFYELTAEEINHILGAECLIPLGA